MAGTWLGARAGLDGRGAGLRARGFGRRAAPAGHLTLICSYTGTLNWLSATSVTRSE